MTESHPITPPPELVVQWIKEFSQPNDPRWQEYEQDIATRAAQWGADQELEACCEWLEEIGPSGVQLWGDDLRKDRRPKPPSLKEQAMRVLLECGYTLEGRMELESEDIDIIHRALEQLPYNG
jgi:hypothetical protein